MVRLARQGCRHSGFVSHPLALQLENATLTPSPLRQSSSFRTRSSACSPRSLGRQKSVSCSPTRAIASRTRVRLAFRVVSQRTSRADPPLKHYSEPDLHGSQPDQLQASCHPHRYPHPSQSPLPLPISPSVVVALPLTPPHPTSFPERPRRVLQSPQLLQPGLPRHEAGVPQEVRATDPQGPRRRRVRQGEDGGRRDAQGAQPQGQPVHHQEDKRLAFEVL